MSRTAEHPALLHAVQTPDVCMGRLQPSCLRPLRTCHEIPEALVSQLFFPRPARVKGPRKSVSWSTPLVTVRLDPPPPPPRRSCHLAAWVGTVLLAKQLPAPGQTCALQAARLAQGQAYLALALTPLAC